MRSLVSRAWLCLVFWTGWKSVHACVSLLSLSRRRAPVIHSSTHSEAEINRHLGAHDVCTHTCSPHNKRSSVQRRLASSASQSCHTVCLDGRRGCCGQKAKGRSLPRRRSYASGPLSRRPEKSSVLQGSWVPRVHVVNERPTFTPRCTLGVWMKKIAVVVILGQTIYLRGERGRPKLVSTDPVTRKFSTYTKYVCTISVVTPIDEHHTGKHPHGLKNKRESREWVHTFIATHTAVGAADATYGTT